MAAVISINRVIRYISLEVYEKQCKKRKIVQIFDRDGINGINKLRAVKNNRFLYMINRAVKVSDSSGDDWISLGVLLAKYKSLELFHYILPFLVENEHRISSNKSKLLHLLCYSAGDVNSDHVIRRIDYYLHHYNVNLNCIDVFGRNCIYYVDNLQVYNYLISKGAIYNGITDEFGYTPIQYMTLTENNLFISLISSSSELSSVVSFVMKHGKNLAGSLIKQILEHVPNSLFTDPIFYDCCVFLAAIHLLHTKEAVFFLNRAQLAATRMNISFPTNLNDDLSLLDFYDNFLIEKCGISSHVRQYFLSEGYSYGHDVTFLGDNSYYIPTIRFLCFKRHLDMVLEFTYKDFNQSYNFLKYGIAISQTMTGEERISYLHRIINIYPSWNYIYSSKFIFAWFYACFQIPSYDIRQELAEFIFKHKWTVANLISNLYSNKVSVDFVELYLQLKPSLNDSAEIFRNFASNEWYTHFFLGWHTKIVKVLLSYGVHFDMVDVALYSKLRLKFGPELVPIPALQCLALTVIKRYAPKDYKKLVPPLLLKVCE